MKKLCIGFLVFLLSFTVFAGIYLSTPSTILYLLNWGEYIDSTLVEKFEKEYHCQVIEENVTSSEAMYQKITSKTTAYDVAIPGDYTVSQLYKEGYLLELDTKNQELERLYDYQNIFVDKLENLMNKYMVDENNKSFSSYYMPYFYGSYSLIYSEKNKEVEEVLKSKGFEALWNRELFESSVKIGMYDTARWIVASFLLSKGLDPNITDYEGNKNNDLSEEIKKDCIAQLKKNAFNEFGNDSLKRNVSNGSLDFCYTQSGDFFDSLYLSFSENKDVNFNMYIPETTAAFFDSMVIPTTSQNYDLANKFINFMLRNENAYQNALTIGYSPTLKSVVDTFNINSKKSDEYYYEDENKKVLLSEFLNKYPYYLDPLYGTKNVYVLEAKSKEYLTTCESIFNSLA